MRETPFRREVEHLPAGHAAEARRARQLQHERGAHACLAMHLLARHHVEGERQQRVAGQDRGRLVEGLVHGRPPAPQVVIVHGRQVVMHQRIAMHQFERAAGGQRAVAVGAEQRGALHQQERAQAFAAAQRRMLHGG